MSIFQKQNLKNFITTMKDTSCGSYKVTFIYCIYCMSAVYAYVYVYAQQKQYCTVNEKNNLNTC